jgi:hypothetical protein
MLLIKLVKVVLEVYWAYMVTFYNPTQRNNQKRLQIVVKNETHISKIMPYSNELMDYFSNF